MQTVKDIHKACLNTVNRLDKSDIVSKYDLGFKLPKALDTSIFTVTSLRGQIGITLKSLAMDTNEPLLIVKTTFTKEHGLKHCVVKLNPKLKALGLRFDTSIEDACLFVRCLYRQSKQKSLKENLSELKLKQYAIERQLEDFDKFLNDNAPKITDRVLQTNIKGEFKKCL